MQGKPYFVSAGCYFYPGLFEPLLAVDTKYGNYFGNAEWHGWPDFHDFHAVPWIAEGI